MNQKSIYLGNALVSNRRANVEGQFVEIDNEKYYKISNCNQMADFFMTIVSHSDHWMFISSNGSLTAGRKDRNSALFPYYTVDKIYDYKGITGSKTYVLVNKDDKTYLWEPFSSESEKIYSIQRNLYKNIYGNKIVFEEVNLDLGIGFKYGWYSSEKFGFVKKSFIINHNPVTVSVDILDGIKNILPNGVESDFQNAYSNLLDAYKKSELLEETKLGLFMLSSIPVDKAEPSESLKATTVWTGGLGHEVKILISNNQVGKFMKGFAIATETDIRASRGAYFVNACFDLTPGEKKGWTIVAEVNQESGDVANLNNAIKTNENLLQLVDDDIIEGTQKLQRLISNADGSQYGNDELAYARHFSNTLFNVMRGGVFIDSYTITTSDFRLFVGKWNKMLGKTFAGWLEMLPEKISYAELISAADKTLNPDLIRICTEYLPLTFSRRHGDPSRPWNHFSIETKNPDGSVKLNYEGNWRDIFQNWEALSFSYPAFVEGMITKFVNATTPDGYNPYRITRDGIDWECPDPHDPWSYIGYWGDHQIIYLQKFLELSDQFHPGALDEMLVRDVFVYANVPYRLKPYAEIVKNPKDTIVFDFELNDKIKECVKAKGSDGVLLRSHEDAIYHVNLTEKILVTLLAKLSNFIPEAGIWLNTQRPEWNDANNALVGNGVSMVTLYYLRRFLQFWSDQFETSKHERIPVSEEVEVLFTAIYKLFDENKGLLEKGFSDGDRRNFVDSLGKVGGEYRNTIYNKSFSGIKKSIDRKAFVDFTQLVLEYMDQSIRTNKRDDGLYHTYNLISFGEDGISIRNLYEMLEGQVAVLSSGYLSVHESVEVLNALKNSSLYRVDQDSYLLYPDRQLPIFIEKNNIPNQMILDSKLLSALVYDRDLSIISSDDLGNFHFNGAFRNANVLEKALNELDSIKYSTLVAEEKELVLGVYDALFDHQSFTGRSGTFYGYEGLGSIYWHMVSKLLLAAQEVYIKGVIENADKILIDKLKSHYLDIKAGIGLNKSPELYGAFPTDAYSHTPGNAGVQQPGMTGLVKEDFISRMRELGVHFYKGEIVFKSSLFSTHELLKIKGVFNYYDVKGAEHSYQLQEGQFGFTFCQVPVVYAESHSNSINLLCSDGNEIHISGHVINKEQSAKIFNRTGEIIKIEVAYSDFVK